MTIYIYSDDISTTFCLRLLRFMHVLYVHIHAHIHWEIHMHTHIHTHIHTHTHTHMYLYRQAQIDIHTHKYTYAYEYNIYIYIFIYILISNANRIIQKVLSLRFYICHIPLTIELFLNNLTDGHLCCPCPTWIPQPTFPQLQWERSSWQVSVPCTHGST